MLHIPWLALFHKYLITWWFHVFTTCVGWIRYVVIWFTIYLPLYRPFILATCFCHVRVWSEVFTPLLMIRQTDGRWPLSGALITCVLCGILDLVLLNVTTMDCQAFLCCKAAFTLTYTSRVQCPLCRSLFHTSYCRRMCFRSLLIPFHWRKYHHIWFTVLGKLL